jgi:hypothetical protein
MICSLRLMLINQSPKGDIWIITYDFGFWENTFIIIGIRILTSLIKWEEIILKNITMIACQFLIWTSRCCFFHANMSINGPSQLRSKMKRLIIWISIDLFTVLVNFYRVLHLNLTRHPSKFIAKRVGIRSFITENGYLKTM